MSKTPKSVSICFAATHFLHSLTQFCFGAPERIINTFTHVSCWSGRLTACCVHCGTFCHGALRLSLPEDVALQLITLLLFVLSLKPHGLLFLLRLLTQTVHQPVLPQGFLLSIKHTNKQEASVFTCQRYPMFIPTLNFELKFFVPCLPFSSSASMHLCSL